MCIVNRFRNLTAAESRKWFEYIITYFDPETKEFISRDYPEQLIWHEDDPPCAQFNMAKFLHGKLSTNQNREKVSRYELHCLYTRIPP